MGGQSAFGTKAGDTFMRITIVTVAIWFVFCVGIHKFSRPGKQDSGMGFGNNQPAVTVPADTGTGTDSE
jgi:preprotein translocase subunit SecG